MHSKRKIPASFFFLVFFVPIAAFAAFNWYENSTAKLPYFGEHYTLENSGEQHYTVPGFAFVNQDSAALNSQFVKGKVWVVHYFFISCPSICPKMLANVKVLQDAFKGVEGVKLISLTVNPEHDTPYRLKAYAKAKGIDLRQWQLGTGTKEDLYRFARKGLFIDATDGDGGPDDFIHSDKFVLIDQHGHIRGYYDGTNIQEVKLLINDIKKIK